MIYQIYFPMAPACFPGPYTRLPCDGSGKTQKRPPIPLPARLQQVATRADSADRFGEVGGKFWPRGPNLPPFSTFFTDLGRFILKLLNFDIYFYFMCTFYIYLVVWLAKHALTAFEGHDPVPPGSAYEPRTS